MTHEFLSDGWFAAIGALGPPPPGPGPFDRPVNMVVTTPDGAAVEIHFGEGTLGKGLSTGAPTLATTTVEVIRAPFLDGDQHAAMHAFMAGEVHVEGDIGTLMAMGTTPPSDEQRAYVRSVRAVTERLPARRHLSS